ncbi:hypothetical protein [Myroides pelagicus]|uniref:Uncharacterized protein n=1 Tax=Myroides pelagicus TaxID=270914 RepID=A0A7K1GIE8_9FLAO|nr:hypothetical protein [Myroides pelagicus]MEC4112882.1 hypothetical protein [Myroides pelagicus]MTH28692.1 hypothetical protein [Myroides pelagicus]
MHRLLPSIILLLLLGFIGCDTVNDQNHYPEDKVKKNSQDEIESMLSTYTNYVNNYKDLYSKALSGDKKALKSYSDLMLKVDESNQKLNKLIDQQRLTSNQLKKYISLKKRFTP